MSGWAEELHPRKPDGEFAKKGGSNWVGKLSDRMGADIGEGGPVSSIIRPTQGIKLPQARP